MNAVNRPPVSSTRFGRWCLAVAAAVAVASVVVVLLLVTNVRSGTGLARYDWRVLRVFRHHRNADVLDLSNALAGFGTIQTQIVLAALAGALLWWRGLRPALYLAPLASLLVAGGFVLTLKAIVTRPGPSTSFRFAAASTGSFPSGHSADTTALAIAVAIVLVAVLVRGVVPRIAVFAAAIGLSLAVGVSRLVLGVHWPTDVVAGWAIGLGSAIAVATFAILATDGRPFAATRPTVSSGQAV